MQGVDRDIQHGKTYALISENDTGKSTLRRILSGIAYL